MLKTVLYYLLLLTTTVRFVDILYLLTRNSTNLPLPVILMTTAMVIYGVVLIVKKFVSTIRLKQLYSFYLIQTVMIVFNISYMAIACPLQINAVETLAVGTFLDLLVNVGIVVVCSRHMRRGFAHISHIR